MIEKTIIDILKSADWYYDFCDGLADWNKAKKTYDAAVKALGHMTPDVQSDLIQRFVPVEMQKKVSEDINK